MPKRCQLFKYFHVGGPFGPTHSQNKVNIIGKSTFCTLIHVTHFNNVHRYISSTCTDKVLSVKYTYDATPKLKTKVNVSRLGRV